MSRLPVVSGQEVVKGTLRNIVREVGLTVEDFAKLL